jgi:ubiquitin-protein ligase E3 C
MFTSSFDGDFKTKRQISLGGRRQAPGERQDLLRQAQLERQQREDERRRQSAAITIQVRWLAVYTLHYNP